MRKKILSYVLIGVIAFSVIGCSNKDNAPDSSGGTKTEDSVEEQPIADVPLSDIHTAVKDAYGEDYIPNMPYEEATITDLFGIQKDWYDEIIAEGPMISANVDTFIAVKAKEGKAADVEKALKGYREGLISDTLQYPMNIPKINGSQVFVKGNYVFFVMLGIIPDDATTDEQMLEAAKKENQKAIDAIETIFEK